MDPDPTASKPIRPTWNTRLLAEAVRALEDARGAPLTGPPIEAPGSSADFETRIVIRAARLPVANALKDGLARISRGLNWGVAIALLVAFLAGLGATRLLFGLPGETPVNVTWLLGGLLLPPSIALLIWLLLLAWRPGSGAVLGGGVMSVLRGLARRAVHDPNSRAALEAWLAAGRGGTLGRWRLSALSHGLWTAFLLGGLVMGLGVLSLWQFDFVWQTTILPEPVVPAILAALASPLTGLGLDLPDLDRILASRAGTEAAGTTREAWAIFLMAALVAYGIVPRFVLLAVSLGMTALCRRRYRLDLTQPEFERLHDHLMAPGRRDGVVDPDRMPPQPAPTVMDEGPPPRLDGAGPLALVGLEIPPPATWPPAVPGAQWLDLGLVDSRPERARLFERLHALTPRPRALLVVCSLAQTPDRGMVATLERLVVMAPCPLLLLLSDGARLRRRGHPEDRWRDWRRTAAAAGLPANHLIEADLTVADPPTLDRLAHLLDPARADLS